MQAEGVYALTPSTGINPPALRGNGADFVGLSPDGEVYVLAGGTLVETDTGQQAADVGLPQTLTQANFSPDGAWLTFVETGAEDGRYAIGVGRWSKSARKYSDHRSFSISTGDAPDASFPLQEGHPQWPSFLPDSQAVVFANTTTNDLYLLDLGSERITLLAKAMGFEDEQAAKDEKTYLPFGSEEIHQSYYPTVAPVSAGGYFWVFFDSSRRYGNIDTSKLQVSSQPIQLPAWWPFPIPANEPIKTDIPSRQLWVTAIEIAPDGSYTQDRSSPAFYLPGQEVGSNNHRAFAALDPCRDNGDSCTSGTECCKGFCSEGECTGPSERCSQTEEACQTAADCCDTQQQCINGFCSVLLL